MWLLVVDVTFSRSKYMVEVRALQDDIIILPQETE